MRMPRDPSPFTPSPPNPLGPGPLQHIAPSRVTHRTSAKHFNFPTDPKEMKVKKILSLSYCKQFAASVLFCSSQNYILRH